MTDLTLSLDTPTITKLSQALADLDARKGDFRKGTWTPPSADDADHERNVKRKLWNAVCDRLGVSGILTYSSNNSGGSWWLGDDDWRAMHDAGWSVHWLLKPPPGKAAWEHGGTSGYESDPVKLLRRYESDGTRWLGALAKSAAIPTSDPNGTVAAWESLTGQHAGDEGCNCCGNPHDFTFYDRNGESHYSGIRVVSSFEGFDL